MKKRLLNFMRFLIHAVLALSIVIGTFPSALAAVDGSVTVRCSKDSAAAGESVDVVVSVSDAKNLAGYLLYIYCDTAVFQASLDEEDGTLLVRRGDFTGSGTIMGNAFGDDGWQVLWFAPKNVSGSGSLFTLTFVIDEAAASGEYEIRIGYSPENTIDVEGNLCELNVTGTSLLIEGKPSPSETPEGDSDDSGGSDNEPTPDTEHDGKPSGETKPPLPGTPPSSANAPEEDSSSADPWGEDFVDVGKMHWAYAYVMELAKQNIVSGTGDGHFYPERQVTRAEFVKMLAGIAGVDVTGRTTDRFDDVKIGQWWMPYVAWASEEGLVNGISETLFEPGQHMTREQMATLIYRFCEKNGISLPEVQERIVFNDEASVASYARKPIESVQAAGIINGYEDGTFRPKVNAKRSEAAKVLCTLLAFMDEY